jgi:hypothetical protein
MTKSLTYLSYAILGVLLGIMNSILAYVVFGSLIGIILFYNHRN